MQRRVLIAGAAAAYPLGGAGAAWAFLHWVLGFQRLGWDTYYVEEIEPARCIDEEWQSCPFETSANVRFFDSLVAYFGLEGRAALLSSGDTRHAGLNHHQVDDLATDADLFINLSGRFHRRTALDAARRRIYVDLDPGFVQIWQQQYGADMNLAGHDVYLTVGLNLGRPGCPLPTCGIEWYPTLPPVVLDRWKTVTPAGSRYTTVADWRGYSPVEWNGVWYGQKSEEFLKIIDLPRRVSVPLELCLAIHPDEPDLARLKEHGWHLAEPRRHAATASAYRDYVQDSRGECTAVKNGYAVGRSGWFSDRSACYLAAGRPVIVQDTGLSPFLPVGAGLLVFDSVETAASAIEEVERDFELHEEAALRLARTHLDSDIVLGRVIELARI